MYPKEIEHLLDEHDMVKESAIIGVPHPDLGETVVAVVVLNPGEDLVEADLKALLADELAHFKQPKLYRAVQELPRNVMGKVQKAQLRERFAAIFTR